MKAAILFDLFGPYHWARINAAGAGGDVTGIELFGSNVVYPWVKVEGERAFAHFTLFPDGHRQSVPPRTVARKLAETLAASRPEVVFLPGWSDHWSIAALRWCLKNAVPAVVMSESTLDDEPRRGWKEAIKRRIVGWFSAGIVGGSPHREYLRMLGMPDDQIFTGYDAVDNKHFAAGAQAVRADASGAARQLGLSTPCFLASSRFAAKKNLLRLLEAYAGYRRLAEGASWDLVLLGGGPLAPQIVKRCEELEINDAVRMPGFRQYDQLPAYYGLAQVFVHASTSEQWGLVVNEAMAAGLPVLVSACCGCAPDLVHHGRNGYTFDPYDVAALSQRLRQMADPATDLVKMSAESQRIIADWSLERFARAFWQAAKRAQNVRRPRPGLTGRILLDALARRQ